MLQVEVPVEPDEGLLADAPIVLYYAHTDPAYNTDLYKAQISRCCPCSHLWHETIDSRFLLTLTHLVGLSAG